jgi:cytoskeletal protein CcmA (bactofilin family)
VGKKARTEGAGQMGIPARAEAPPKQTTPETRRSSVMLGPNDRLIGQLFIEGDLHLDGTVEGEVSATGDVEIADEARVKASVAGGDVSIHGHVNGAVTARKRLVVARSGSLIGDVRVARLVVQDGATFSGNVSMGPHVDAPPKPPEPVETPEPATEPVAEPVAEVIAEPIVTMAPVPVVVKAAPAAAKPVDGHGKAAAQKSKPKAKQKRR